MSQSDVNRIKTTDSKIRQGETCGKYSDLTLRWALRESLPPTEVTLQVYVPMSPDHVWEMCRVPSGSSRRRGDVFTSITEPLFSHTYLKVYTCVCKCSTYIYCCKCCDSKSVCFCQLQQNTEGTDTDEKPCAADSKAI